MGIGELGVEVIDVEELGVGVVDVGEVVVFGVIIDVGILDEVIEVDEDV